MKKNYFPGGFTPLEPLDKDAQTAQLTLLIRQVRILKSQIEVLRKVMWRFCPKNISTTFYKLEIWYLAKQYKQLEKRIDVFYKYHTKAN